MPSPITLHCTIHPSPNALPRVTSLLQHGSKTYYTNRQNLCTTWSYFTPYPSPPSSQQSSSQSPPVPVLCGIEIYTSKTALESQRNDKDWFQWYHSTVKSETLYARDEEIVAWEFTSGFLCREGRLEEEGKRRRCLVSITMLKGRGARNEGVVDVLGEFARWVEKEEEGVFTYAVFTRRKEPGDVMIWGRYRDGEALRRHAGCEEHRVVVRKLGELCVGGLGDSTTMWEEVEESFVGREDGERAKL